MKKRKEQLKRGSLTIEAALVVPLVLAVIVLLILLIFHVHNRAWYTAAAAETVLTAGTEGVREHYKANRILEEKIEECKKKQGFPIWELTISGAVKGDKVSVTAEALTARGIMSGGWKFHVQESLKIIKPVEFIRKVQGFSELEG